MTADNPNIPPPRRAAFKETRDLRDKIAMEVLNALLVGAPISGMDSASAAQALDTSVRWAYFTADRAMHWRDQQEAST